MQPGADEAIGRARAPGLDEARRFLAALAGGIALHLPLVYLATHTPPPAPLDLMVPIAALPEAPWDIPAVPAQEDAREPPKAPSSESASLAPSRSAAGSRGRATRPSVATAPLPAAKGPGREPAATPVAALPRDEPEEPAPSAAPSELLAAVLPPSRTSTGPKASKPELDEGHRAEAALALRGYRALLAQLIERRKRYPALSLRRREEGAILVRVTIGRRGDLIHLTTSTPGPAQLVRASLDAVRDAAPFPALPEQLGTSAVIDISVVYRITPPSDPD